MCTVQMCTVQMCTVQMCTVQMCYLCVDNVYAVKAVTTDSICVWWKDLVFLKLESFRTT